MTGSFFVDWRQIFRYAFGRQHSSWGLDWRSRRMDNGRMNMVMQADDLSVEVLADLEAVCRQSESGLVRDPDLLRRVYERSARAREATLRNLGVQNIGVEII